MNDSLLRPGEIGKIILDVEAINEDFDGLIFEHVIYEDLKDVATEEEIKQLIRRAIDLGIVRRLSPRHLQPSSNLELVREYRNTKGELPEDRLREIHEYTFDLNRRSEYWKTNFKLRCLNFRNQRLSELETEVTFNTHSLDPPPWVVLHLVPGTPLLRNDEILQSYMASLEPRSLPIKPMGFFYGALHEGFEGDDYVTYAYDESTASAYSYIRIFANGIIEAVRADFSRNGVPRLPMRYERDVIETLSGALSMLKALGIEPPLGVTLTLSGMKGSYIVNERGIVPGGRMITHPRLHAPVVQIPNFDVGLNQAELAQLMKDTFDRVWRDAEYSSGSQNYDENGLWKLG